jgi:hypothetical protein
MTRQRSHMGFTDGRTFKLDSRFLVAVGDAATGDGPPITPSMPE